MKQENFDSMEAYLKKESGQWINLTEEGFALCEKRRLYVSNQSMVVGNTYSLLVTYDNGKGSRPTCGFNIKKTAVLKFTVISTVCLETHRSLERSSALMIPEGRNISAE